MFYIGMVLAGIAGAFIQTVVGFGAAVVILLYLTSFMSISTAPSVASVICLVLNLTMFLQFQKALQLRRILVPMAIYSVLSLAIVFTIRSIRITLLTYFFGAFLILLSVYYLFLSKRLHIRDNGTGMMLASSGLSGLFAGLFSIGGPTLSIYYLALLGTGDAYIAGLQFSFMASNIVLCCGRIANGLLTADMLPTILFGLAGAITGQQLGRRVRGKIGTELLSRLVYLAVGLSGLVVILQQLF